MKHPQSIVQCIAVVLFCIIASSLGVRVTVKNGTLEGMPLKTRKGRDIAAFKSIPYAQPPVGELRFQPPHPSTSWRGVRDATVNVPSCIQAMKEVFNYNPEQRTSEDCLYLNVYTPKLIKYRERSRQKLYPVMVWIHGGAYYAGTSHSLLYGPEFLLDHDIVLVTINYRVGAFGFLSTADGAAYGNQGLKDQVQALRWVQENIAAFGGDASSVTIAGESAGGASVHYLMISPLARGLFHRAISQSGTSLAPWAFNTPETARNQAIQLGAALGCCDKTKNSTNLVNCLRRRSAEEILQADAKRELTVSQFEGDSARPFHRPVIEPQHPGAYLMEHPIEALSKGHIARVPWISGFNGQEGCVITAGLYGMGDHLINLVNMVFVPMSPQILLLNQECSFDRQLSIGEKIREFYLGEKDIAADTMENLLNMQSDAYFTVSGASSVKKSFNTTTSPMFYYYFNYRSKWSWSDAFGDPKRDYGVCHADELQYLFPLRKAKGQDTPYTEEDYKMVDVLTTLWYNFMKHGVPTTRSSDLQPVNWQNVQTDALEQLVINSPTNISMSKDVIRDRLSFWEKLPCHAGTGQFSNKI